MQMIDVLKRLAELDQQNPRVMTQPQIIKQGVAESQIEECGMMPEMHMDSMKPSTPATINMTAGSADELGALLKDIVSLAGLSHQDDHAEPMGDMPPPAEPEMGPPESGADAMRSTIDKLNPMDDEEGGEEDDEEETEGMLGTMAGAGLGAVLGGPLGAALGGAAGDELTGDDEQEEDYDNKPNDPTNPPPFDSNKMSNQDPAGHPGAGDRMDGDRPKAFATFEDQLIWEYKKFIKG